MRYLLDTNLVIRAFYEPEKLSPDTVDLLSDPSVDVRFSAVNIWEIAIKAALGRPDFTADARAVRDEALAAGFAELVVDGAHAAAVGDLPPIHSDPFDRLLIAQAIVSDSVLLTSDRTVARYTAPVRLS
ncbi:type II toxin-antitoxin system VapC family toxin [Isoptericola sp. NPDC019482]|uniref:type II toxin-antitoxin system VapC family toxin n=1 Tax=Isoptericola sp. NPDC019482 TaxID=3154688 RepID=UPI00346A9944